MKYRPEIDGLRALAVLPVILFHAGFEIFSGGFVGVDIFFVISGYLITSIICAEIEQGNFSIISFYERRARRILPALFIVMFACIPFAWLLLLPSDMKDFSQSMVAVPVFLSNFLFWRESGYFDSASELKPLLHTWSLAVEEQYYVLFPPLMLFLGRLGNRKLLFILILIFITSLSLAQLTAVTHPTAAFFLLPTRIWELMVGVFSALYLSQRKDRVLSGFFSEAGGWLGVALILYAMFSFDKETPFPGLYALVPTIGAVMIILFATQHVTAGKFIGGRVFVAIGLISYSAYLWHQPVFAFARQMSLNEPSAITFSLLVILVLVLAYLSWRYVEIPFRKRREIGRRSIFLFSFLFSLFFICVGLIGVWQANRGVANSQMLDMATYERQLKSCWGSIERDQKLESACVLGNESLSPTFALLGDSHAGSLLFMLDKEAKSHNLGGRNLSYRSCPPLSTALPLSSEVGDITCYELRKNFFTVLEESPGQLPDFIIVNARWALLAETTRYKNQDGGMESGGGWIWSIPSSGGDYYSVMRQEIVSSINKIIHSGKTVVLVYPVPEMGWDIPRVLTKHKFLDGQIYPNAGSISYDDFLMRNKRAISMLDSIPQSENILRIRPDKIFCDTFIKARCISHLDGLPLYFDNNHLSNFGSSFLVSQIIEYIKNK